MASSDTAPARRRFPRVQLPWLAGATALLVYLLTLNQWVSLSSLAATAQVFGWTWQPVVAGPLTVLFFKVFSFLPGPWRPVLLNVSSAAMASVVIVCLARSVAIWPRSEKRLHHQFQHASTSGAAAFLPPLLAALACGLQLTFWEHATTATGEMLNLLIFALVIVCILEFRRSNRAAWLWTSALLFGAGMANDWGILACLPLFLLAIVLIKRIAFLQPAFLLRLFLWALVGTSCYLLLPILQLSPDAAEPGFLEVLKTVFREQALRIAYFPRPVFVAMLLVCVLPLVLISVRWRRPRSHAGDDNPATAKLSRSVSHSAHAGLMLLGLWMALGPILSPRHLGALSGTPLLICHYLSALVIGYCAGYLLLIRSVRMDVRLGTAMVCFIVILSGVTAVLLVGRNLPQVRLTNGPALRSFARELVSGLPDGRSVVLTDEAPLDFLLKVATATQHTSKDPIILNTKLLNSAPYQRHAAAKYRERWSWDLSFDNRVPGQSLRLVQALAAHEPLLYLHPSFGYYFEAFDSTPRGLISVLVPRSARTDSPGEPVAQGLSEAESVWNRLWTTQLAPLNSALAGNWNGNERRGTTLLGPLRLAAENNSTLAYLSRQYSRAMNVHAVRLQYAGKWDTARTWLDRAVAFNRRNVIARVNLEFNARHTREDGRAPRLRATDLQDFLGGYQRLDAALVDNGPADEPTLLVLVGEVFSRVANFNQAAQCFARAAELAPEWPEAALALARTQLRLHMPEQALKALDRIAPSPSEPAEVTAGALYWRALALQALGRTNHATAILDDAVERHASRPEVLSCAALLYCGLGDFHRALRVYEGLLRSGEKRPDLLANKAVAEMQLADPAAAAATLSRALEYAPSNHIIRLNRAVALVKSGQLDSAQEDYECLLQNFPGERQVLLGLAEVAWRKGKTNIAQAWYSRCLPSLKTNSTEYLLAARRLGATTARPASPAANRNDPGDRATH